MLLKCFERHFLRDLLLALRYDRDDVAVCNRCMYQDAGCMNMRHDGHEVHCLMGRSLVDLEGIGQSAVIITRVSHTADNRNRDFFNPVCPVKAVNGTDEACCIAACQFQEILAYALLEVGIAMEEDVRYRVLLAALEDSLDAGLLIENLVLRADAGRCGVKHDIHFSEEILECARYRDSQLVEIFFICAVHQIEVIGHAFFVQRTDCQCRGHIGNADQFHISLARHTVCQSLSDCSVTSHTNSYFCHDFLYSFRIHEPVVYLFYR